MIDIRCNNCQAAMQVDEAFAGSTCRCQKCGTIQTVPKQRRSAEPPGAGKTLYSNLNRGGSASSGLDALADVMSSSGLSSGLRESTRGAPAKNVRRIPLAAAVAGGAVGVLATVVVVIILTRGQRATVVTPSVVLPTIEIVPDSTPSFCGIEIKEPVVIYLVDRGNSARDAMGHLSNAAIRSIRSLGSDRKFQIIFWDNGQPDNAFPPGAPQFATPEAVNAARRALESVVAFGRTDVEPALKKALSSKPNVIMLVTAKGAELDDAFADLVINQQKSAGAATRIHTIAIGEPGEALPRVAQTTGGQHVTLSMSELRDASN